MELPQYSVKPNVSRILILKITLLLILAIGFYFALWLNLKLGFNMAVPFVVNIAIVLVLVVAVLLELIRFHVVYSQYEFLFYTNRVIFKKKDKIQTFLFKDLKKIDFSQGLLDKIMKTGTIKMNKKFKVGPINKPKKVYEYLLKLIKYYKSTKDMHSDVQDQEKTFLKSAEVN